MTRAETIATYRISEVGTIQNPGKFEGEMLYAPHFYELVMDGAADDTIYESDRDDETPVDVFGVTAEDIAEFPELADAKTVHCSEDSNGFFYCSAE